MWINSADYDPAVARKNNLTFEGGLGTEYSAKCLIPFIESRVSSKWKESFLIIGLKICMANCKGRYKVISCPGFSQ